LPKVIASKDDRMQNKTTWSCRWKLILRYALRRTINYFAICAVFLSITCLFTVNAVFKGFDQEMQAMFKGSLSDILVDFSWNSPTFEELEEKLTSFCWSAPLDAFGMIRTDRYVSAIQVKGIDPIKESQLRTVTDKSIPFMALQQEGSSTSPLGGLLNLFGESDLDQPDGILIGSALARNLNLAVGDRVQLVLPNWMDQVSQRHFMVKKIFHSGFYEDDSNRVFIQRTILSDLLNHPSGYSVVQINYKAGDQYLTLKNELSKLFPAATISTWRDRHAIKLRAVVNERKLIALVLSMIVIVASFGILAIQWSFVQEKTRDIGLLRAMGFKRKDIFSVFLGVSWIVGLLGLGLGLVGGITISTYANDLIALTGWQPFPDGIYYMDQGLPFSIEWEDALWISLLSISVTTLAGFLPALRAVKVEPIKAIAYE